MSHIKMGDGEGQTQWGIQHGRERGTQWETQHGGEGGHSVGHSMVGKGDTGRNRHIR